MTPLNDKERHALQQTTIHYSEVLTFFERWYRSELERLPLAADKVQIGMGRCQVLAEIHKTLTDLRQQNQSR